MIFETVKSEGLAHFSYLIGDEEAGVCAIIDPRFDIDEYLRISFNKNLRIVAIIETHIQADYLSGALSLAEYSGVSLYMGENALTDYPYEPLREGDQISIGAYTLEALHTPGHTPEHISLLISGGPGSAAPWGVFTGDTLFAGEVGRPDLLGEGTEKMLVSQLYHTLFNKLLALDDGTMVFPGHGQGSPCGAQIGDRPVTTIGYERHNNPALQASSEREFADRVLNALAKAPAYYQRVKRLNTTNPPHFQGIPSLISHSAAEVEGWLSREDLILLDTRPPTSFSGAHIPVSVNIAFDGPFPIWVGSLLDPEKDILLILDRPEDAEEVTRSLLRIGYDRIIGILNGGIEGWITSGRRFSRTKQISAQEVNELRERGADFQLLDIRGERAYAGAHIAGAISFDLTSLPEEMKKLDRRSKLIIYCTAGYRSSLVASLLKKAGFENVSILAGSITAWGAAGYPLT